MAGFTTGNTEFFIRSNLYSRQLKTLLLDDLNAMKFVRMLSDFPDGQTFNIPSLGEAETADFVEGQAIKYNSMDTGNFTFSFDTYKYSANAISEKMKRDSYWASDILSAFVPRQHRALMEAVETDILNKANAGQTASDLNNINNASHRWVGQGTSGNLALIDFPAAQFALFKANVPQTNMCAIIDPATAYTLQTQPNFVNFMSPMRQSEEIVVNGGVSGFKFRYNFYGFDIYVSNYLPKIASETINGTTVTTGVANYFFSASPGDTLPWIGGFRQMPTVYSEFNKDLQQEEHLTIAEWGFKLFRPENLVTILTPTTVTV